MVRSLPFYVGRQVASNVAFVDAWPGAFVGIRNSAHSGLRYPSRALPPAGGRHIWLYTTRFEEETMDIPTAHAHLSSAASDFLAAEQSGWGRGWARGDRALHRSQSGSRGAIALSGPGASL